MRFNSNNVPLYFIYQYNANGQLLHESKYKNSSLDKKWSRETIWLGNRPEAQVRTSYSNGVVSSADIYYILSDH